MTTSAESSPSAPETQGGVSKPRQPDRTAYAEAVNALVRQIPIGRVMTYGLIAEILQEEMGIGGPRVVGNVLAGAGDRYAHVFAAANNDKAVIGPAQDNFDIPWWRVVNAAGSPPLHYLSAALEALARENTPMKKGNTKVNLEEAIWFPGVYNSVGLGDAKHRLETTERTI